MISKVYIDDLNLIGVINFSIHVLVLKIKERNIYKEPVI